MKTNLNFKKTEVEYKKFTEIISDLRRKQNIILRNFSKKAEAKKLNKIRDQLSKSKI